MLQKDLIEPAKQHLRQALQANGQLEEARELLVQLEHPSGGPMQASLSFAQ
jgi:hypothetical protein